MRNAFIMRNTTLKIAEMPESEKPREKGARYGIRSLANRELLALLLRTGVKGSSVLGVADELLYKAGGITGLAAMNKEELTAVNGIGFAKAMELAACFELSRRIALERVDKDDVISDPEALIQWLQKEIGLCDQEKLIAVYLDNGCRVIGHRHLFTGTINMSMIYPREIFREAIILKATAVMIAHNHPGGDPTPSKADLDVTQDLIMAGKMMRIKVLDHIIVTSNRWFSFAGAGLMEECGR